MRQWMLRITKYAGRLIKDLDTVDYLDKIKSQRINWIGKSEGAEVDFGIKNESDKINVFTTRPDTLFGCTYIVLSPEHPLIEKFKNQIENFKEVEKYQEKARNKSDLERTDLAKEKSGVELRGLKAINPVNRKEIPIWIALNFSAKTSEEPKNLEIEKTQMIAWFDLKHILDNIYSYTKECLDLLPLI